MNILRAKKFQEPVQLSDAHPFEQINMLLQSWISLAGECCRNYFFHTRFSRTCSEQPWIDPIAGNDS